ERNEAGRAQGAGQSAAHRRPVPCPGVEGPDQETHYDARQEEAKDRLTRHPSDYRPPRAPRRRCARAFQDLSPRVKLTGGPQEEDYGARKSAADLAIVPLLGGGRPEPPADLGATEQSIGRRSSMPLVLMPSIRPRLVAQAALCERQEARLRALRAQRPDD